MEIEIKQLDANTHQQRTETALKKNRLLTDLLLDTFFSFFK
jgi:hypothetical protein